MAEIKVPIQVNLPDDWIEQIVNRLRNDPDAEWVEVTRCKDCIHRPIIDDPDSTDGFGLRFPDDFKCPCRCDDPYYSWMPNDNWFCGNGEKEEKTNE